MDDDSFNLRFPVELDGALLHIRGLAERRHGFIVSRRITRRAMRKVDATSDVLWQVIESLEALDYLDGPLADHHCADREVWVFRPVVGGQRMYLKVAFRRVPEGPESALVIWSFHQPRFPMKDPSC